MIKKHRLNQAFYRLVRIRAIKLFIKNRRKIAKTSTERLVLDVIYTIKWNCSSIIQDSFDKSEKIIASFLKEIKENLLVNDKITNYLAKVVIIQRQWRIIAKKKHLYMEIIKKRWKEELIEDYYELLYEKDKSKISVPESRK